MLKRFLRRAFPRRKEDEDPSRWRSYRDGDDDEGSDD